MYKIWLIALCTDYTDTRVTHVVRTYHKVRTYLVCGWCELRSWTWIGTLHNKLSRECGHRPVHSVGSMNSHSQGEAWTDRDESRVTRIVDKHQDQLETTRAALNEIHPTTNVIYFYVRKTLIDQGCGSLDKASHCHMPSCLQCCVVTQRRWFILM